MTVDRAHILATPGPDAHGSYVALSRHRDGPNLHYGRDDFAWRDRLIRTLSRDRSKDTARDYAEADPAQDFAARRGISFRKRVVELLRKVVPERMRDGINGRVDGPGPPARCRTRLLPRHRPLQGTPSRSLTPIRSAARSTPHRDDGPGALARSTWLGLTGSRTSSRRQ